MIDCIEGTVLTFDQLVLQTLRSNHSVYFDSDYINCIHQINGGTPITPYLNCGNEVLRIGWFASLITNDHALPGPHQEGTYYYENDTRFDDRSLIALLDCHVDAYFEFERLIPFAALHSKGEPPNSLQFYGDWSHADSLCFDRSTNPNSIVYCNADLQIIEWQKTERPEPETDIDYESFTKPIANSFREFAQLLRTTL